MLNRHVHIGRLPDVAASAGETRHPAVPRFRAPRRGTARCFGRVRDLVARAARTYLVGAYTVLVADKYLLRELR